MGDNMMTNRKYLVYVIVFVLLLIVLTVGGTYAFFKIQITSESDTVVGMSFDCLNISYSENNTIDLEGQYPVSDEYALSNMKPLMIVVTNQCEDNSEGIPYAVTLTSLKNNVGYIPDSKIRVMIKKSKLGEGDIVLKTPNYLNTLTKFESGNVYSFTNGYLNSRDDTNTYANKNIYRVDYNVLENGETAIYKVYLWMDYYEGDTTHTGLNDNSTEGLDFIAATSVATNVVVVDPQYTITQNDSNYTVSANSATEGTVISLEPVVNNDPLYGVSSFKLNGVDVAGDSFIMPNTNVTITNIQYGRVVFDVSSSDSAITVPSSAKANSIVTLSSDDYGIKSFKMNGQTIRGKSFTMPNEAVVITDVEKINAIIDYRYRTINYVTDPSKPSYYVYETTIYQDVFEDAVSLTVRYTYGKRHDDCNESSWLPASVRLYGRNIDVGGYYWIDLPYTTCILDVPVTKYSVVPGNLAKITIYEWNEAKWHRYFSSSNYGFYIVIIPNYE